MSQKIEKRGEDSLGTGIYYGPCNLCRNRGEAASYGLGHDGCWGWHPVNRIPDGRMKCFQPHSSKEGANNVSV